MILVITNRPVTYFNLHYPHYSLNFLHNFYHIWLYSFNYSSYTFIYYAVSDKVQYKTRSLLSIPLSVKLLRSVESGN
jgi:hypothetical protein